MRAILKPALLALLALSCGSGDNASVPGGSNAAAERSAAKPSEGTPLSGGTGRRSGTASLSQGTIDVFGLRIPRGMTPTKGPEKVYRFEGNHHVSQVVTYVRDQVSVDKVSPEGDGFIFRYAKVNGSKDKTAGETTLAVRIYPRTTGGSVLDIWQERELKVDLPSRAPMFYQASEGTRASPTTSLRAYRARHERALRQTMSPLRKLQNEERLDSNDLKSPFFENE